MGSRIRAHGSGERSSLANAAGHLRRSRFVPESGPRRGGWHVGSAVLEVGSTVVNGAVEYALEYYRSQPTSLTNSLHTFPPSTSFPPSSSTRNPLSTSPRATRRSLSSISPTRSPSPPAFFNTPRSSSPSLPHHIANSGRIHFASSFSTAAGSAPAAASFGPIHFSAGGNPPATSHAKLTRNASFTYSPSLASASFRAIAPTRSCRASFKNCDVSPVARNSPDRSLSDAEIHWIFLSCPSARSASKNPRS